MFDLFDKTVVPVLTYGCEVWGTSVTDITLKLQRKFHKMVLQLRQSTPTPMLFGETGNVSVDVHVKTEYLITG